MPLTLHRSGLPVLALSLVLHACADPAGAPVTGTLATADRSGTTAKNSAAAVDASPLAAAHKANPADPAAALAYARALRAGGAKPEALAVLDKTAAAKPADRLLQLERGLLALDLGQPAKAERLLRGAHDPKAPDWRVHSALGSALASGGRQQEAQVQFAKALALAPDHPTVLNNLALSYALDGKVDAAEKLLRKARPGPAQTPQVKQNLALVLGLRGNFAEARALAAAALPAGRASENVAYLQRLASAKSAANRAEGASDPAAKAARKANASLPQPTYQLRGPPPAN